MSRRGIDEFADGLSAEERRRLERVHELLIEVGPPPELPPTLARPRSGRERWHLHEWRRVVALRRLAPLVALGATIAAATFGIGYLAGAGSEPPPPPAAQGFLAERVVTLQPRVPELRAEAVVRIGRRESGNLPLLLTVQGLARLPRGDYYILYMTKSRTPVVICGTFNVSGPGARPELLFTVGYDLTEFDGFALVEYRRDGHRRRTLMTGKLA